MLLFLHAVMLGWSACKHSPLVDEPAHLASGLSHWQRFSFDLYRVNPPLVRSIAAIPVLFLPHKTDWNSYSDNPYKRAEFQVGTDLIKCNTKKYHSLLLAARFFCIPFSLLGGFICYCWGRDLFGNVSGIMALLLWCFSPMILAFGYTVMPDVASASLGITACYFFWKWTKNPCWDCVWLSGIILGIAELTKFTLLVFYPVWLLIWILTILLSRKTISKTAVFSQSKQLISLFAVSLFVINIAYGFEGTFVQLKNYEFVSRALCGKTKWNHETGFTLTGNRFRGSVAGEIPVPLPVNYLMGIDVQKKEFETGQSSYFCGQWCNDGWYQYYLFGLLIKEPLGFWILLVLAMMSVFVSRKFLSGMTGEMILLFPVIVLLLLVSSQIKLNHHLRYVIPILPFLFIGVSRLAMVFQNKNKIFNCIVTSLLIWIVFSSLYFYPHSQGHFNELIGSPHNAPKYILGSNIDWGQNKLYLIDWYKKHPEVRPLTSYYESLYTKENACLDDNQFIDNHQQLPNEPQLGWYAIGVNELYGSLKQYEYFKQFKPVTIIGYSIYIYYVTQEDVNSVRREMGLPEI
ncbi:MAG: glycosyltransferase family 39 protein [Planctomycetaceae bacterium]|nr:glycosyltransferase family 39 protein [Planctomycetaceae bacterium]